MKKVKIYTRGLLLILIGLCSFYSFAQTQSEVSFVEETQETFVFKNKGATLLIHRKTGLVELIGTDKKTRYIDYQNPVFFVDSKKLTLLAKETSIKKISDRTALLSIPTVQGTALDLFIEKAGDFGFKLKYTTNDAKIIKIRGVIKLNPVEEIYGFGETWNKHLAQRGLKNDIWAHGGTPDECAWMPYYVSTNNYAFYINYGGRVTFDVGQGKADEISYEFEYDVLEYTVIAGNNIATSVQNFVALTGMPAKPPRWTFKPWAWLMSDPDIPGGHISTLKGKHCLDIVKKYKELDIPVGVVWFEPPWQDARTTFIPNKEFSPDLKALIAELDKEGVKTLAWTVPYTSPGASNWNEAVEGGYLVKKPGGETDNREIEITRSGEVEGTFYNKIDFYNPEAYKWWQTQIESAIDLGFKGFKLDAGQATPLDGILYGDRIGKDVHNSIALEYNKIFYESLTKKLGDDFLMVPRAAWTGSNAYTNFKWPGDLSTSFADNGLPSSVYSSLSLSLSGFPFVATDIGGFQGIPSPETVWMRWAQFGAMLPGMETVNMPWWYSEKALKHYRYLSWLHTDLIPYWQSLANTAHATGTPICRPLVWKYQDDMTTWRIDDEFTVGDYILVAPIINTNRDRELYLPEGTWYDFWDNNEVYSGKQNITWFKGWEDSKWKFPLYIKEGAVIPMEITNEVSGFGSEHSKDYITLAMWPEMNAKNEFILNDREGNVPIITDWSQEHQITINWKNSTEDYIFRIHLKENIIPGVATAKKELKKFDNMASFQESTSDGWYFDEESRKLWVKKVHNKNSGELKINLEM